MRCIGITGKYKRCENNCKFIYCYHHRFQWWAVFLILASLLGFYQDFIPLITTENKNENKELSNLLKYRKKKIDEGYLKLVKTAKEIEKDTTETSVIKEKVNESIKKITSSKSELDTLISEHFLAVENGDQVLSHELHSKINNFPKDNNLHLERLQLDLNRKSLWKKYLLEYQVWIDQICQMNTKECFADLRLRDVLYLEYKKETLKFLLSGGESDSIYVDSYLIHRCERSIKKPKYYYII
ncbi:hypothetical protein [Emticicia sp. TH156]|uniref:hypothetical protein n=1 Tax=Emticicia sp. TH156 TaxID=2067454 RepID=UPI000C75C3C3|nr:hypothetical protein [Emticicia sp. TH156]PLK42093.1 hypothetical protein C0V77_22700 [Emticicia sp. TH156]